jgi:septum site-determining protein MinD
VTNPEIPAVTDALKAAKAAEDIGIYVKGVIVTRVKGTSSEMPIANIQDMLELPILGIVPEDKNVPNSVVMKDALVYTHPKSRASRAYRRIAAKLIGKDDYKEKSALLDWMLGRF